MANDGDWCSHGGGAAPEEGRCHLPVLSLSLFPFSPLYLQAVVVGHSFNFLSLNDGNGDA